jgi:3-oxoadipate enol-lactonase
MSTRTSRIRAGDVTLRVQERGEGPPLLLVHGLGMSSDLWVHQWDAFSLNHRTIAVDLRGFGESDRPADAGAYTIERFGEDLFHLIRALDLPRVHLLGTSMGGFVAQALALRAPEMLSSLTLCHTACRMSIPPDILEARVAALASAPMEEYGRMVASQALAPGALPALHDWLVGLVAKNDRETYRRVLVEGLAAFDLEAEVGRIRIPTLVLVGELDRIIPADGGRELARRIVGAEIVDIPGVGHIGYAEKPATFNDAVLGFLRKVTP